MQLADIARVLSARLGVSATNRNTLKMSGRRVSVGDVIAEACRLPDAPDLVPSLMKLAASPTAEKDLVDTLRGIDSPEFSGDMGSPFSAEVPIPLSELTLILFVADKKKSRLYHARKDKVFPISYEVAIDRVRALIGGEGLAQWLNTNQKHCVFEYAPNQGRIVEHPDDIPGFNLWSPAPWAIGWEPPPAPIDPPTEFAEFMAGLFTTDESRQHAAAWLRDATFTRAGSVLLLTGTPGTGKNMFVECLAKPLVGADNSITAQRGFAKTGFQASIARRRLAFFDEMPLCGALREALKQYHNARGTFERKNVEVEIEEDIHASIVVANNHPHRCYLEYSDRKFFVPEVAETQLQETLGARKIKRLVKLAADRDFLRHVAGYLWHAFPAGSSETFPKTRLFEQICIASYPAQFQEFIQVCRRQKTVTAKEVRRGRRFGYSSKEIEGLIKDYAAHFGVTIAKLDPAAIGSNWVAESQIYAHPNGDGE
jgi:hypothetical protein